uniref:Integrase core domain containing protein n=1 Tax=Solanum tuberosum TaxID=4113 RepID=M1DUI9_SOLTU
MQMQKTNHQHRPWVTLREIALTDIDHVSYMESDVLPQTKKRCPTCLSVPNPEGESQVGDRKEQSASRRTVPRCSAIMPKVTELEVSEGQSKKDTLAQKVKDLEVLSKKKDRYIPPHERRKLKEQEGGQIEEVLLLILHRVEEHDIVLEEIRECLDAEPDDDLSFYDHSATSMDQVLSSLYPEPKEEWPYENEANLTNGT